MTEAVAIVTLNIITIIVFMQNRSLRKCSTYLAINLAVADLFVGGISEVMDFFWMGKQLLAVQRGLSWNLGLCYIQHGPVFFPQLL